MATALDRNWKITGSLYIEERSKHDSFMHDLKLGTNNRRSRQYNVLSI